MEPQAHDQQAAVERPAGDENPGMLTEGQRRLSAGRCRWLG